LNDNRAFIDPATANILSNFNAPVLGQTIPSGVAAPVPVPLDVPETQTPAVDVVGPNNDVVAPNNPNPLTITLPAAGRSEAPRTFARGDTTVQAQNSVEGSATATAFPVRRPADARTTVTQPRDGTSGDGAADFVEVQAGGGTPVTANFRGSTETATQRPARTSVYPGYTVWQGYYWYHSPASGWHYWDGGRWTRFADVDRAQ
jgi:hypothetical protein